MLNVISKWGGTFIITCCRQLRKLDIWYHTPASPKCTFPHWAPPARSPTPQTPVCSVRCSHGWVPRRLREASTWWSTNWWWWRWGWLAVREGERWRWADAWLSLGRNRFRHDTCTLRRQFWLRRGWKGNRRVVGGCGRWSWWRIWRLWCSRLWSVVVRPRPSREVSRPLCRSSWTSRRTRPSLPVLKNTSPIKFQQATLSTGDVPLRLGDTVTFLEGCPSPMVVAAVTQNSYFCVLSRFLAWKRRFWFLRLGTIFWECGFSSSLPTCL